MKTHYILLSAIALCFLSSCSVIRPGEIGVKTTFGKLKEKTFESGAVFYNPFATAVIKVPTRTINREMSMNLPSKEGLTILADVSILYRIETIKVITVIKEVGLDFDKIITAVFRSSASDACSQYYAKDMHSGERRNIEKKINDLMNEYLGPRGFIIENVLLKSISLPTGLSKAIEQKLESEQDALRMVFIKQQEEREAERILIKAEGQKKAKIIEAEAKAKVIEIEADANKMANDKLNSSITPNIIKMKQIDAMLELSKSPNSKVMFIDNKNPFMNILEQK
ncbi:MAG: prohibitin family protein [Bacteroidetes bacterium]|nr:MAG: prohibitin family protein [Bacteroidota bacterium]